jgi:hypothetical protein
MNMPAWTASSHPPTISSMTHTLEARVVDNTSRAGNGAHQKRCLGVNGTDVHTDLGSRCGGMRGAERRCGRHAPGPVGFTGSR